MQVIDDAHVVDELFALAPELVRRSEVFFFGRLSVLKAEVEFRAGHHLFNAEEHRVIHQVLAA